MYVCIIELSITIITVSANKKRTKEIIQQQQQLTAAKDCCSSTPPHPPFYFSLSQRKQEAPAQLSLFLLIFRGCDISAPDFPNWLRTFLSNKGKVPSLYQGRTQEAYSPGSCFIALKFGLIILGFSSLIGIVSLLYH